MLVSIQTAGTKPPLFFVHGVHGVMCLGPIFARALGSDRPFYVINANGIDGRQPVIDDVQAMVRAYVGEILAAWPEGPIHIGGMCSGCLIAIEVARELLRGGRKIGPVILADPPPVPFGQNKRMNTIDARRPQIAQQLYNQVRWSLLDHASRPYNDMPFDSSDPNQLHAATLAGVASLAAFGRYIPSPFRGPAQLILSAERASGFFHPQMPWHKLLPGPRMVHVLPWDHHELFRAGRETVAQLLNFVLGEPPSFEIDAKRQMERTVA